MTVKKKKSVDFEPLTSVFDQIVPSLKANVEHRKVHQSHAETSRKWLLLGAGNEFESHQKKQHCNNFREFLIRIRYPVIKPRVFLHFFPIPQCPNAPMPQSLNPPLPRFPTNPLFPPYPSSLNKSSLSFSSTLCLHCLDFFHVDHQPGDQERREKWLWIRNKLMK